MIGNLAQAGAFTSKPALTFAIGGLGTYGGYWLIGQGTIGLSVLGGTLMEGGILLMGGVTVVLTIGLCTSFRHAMYHYRQPFPYHEHKDEAKEHDIESEYSNIPPEPTPTVVNDLPNREEIMRGAGSPLHNNTPRSGRSITPPGLIRNISPHP